MQYALLIYRNENAMEKLSQQESAQMHAAYMAYTEAMKKAGVHQGGHGLRGTSEATTVRAPGGTVTVQNGPFAETREQLGGFYLLDVPDLDVALSWAKRCPGASYGAIEVRPVWI
jgi:hypothetical protein